MSIAIEGLVYGFRKNMDYATKLVADLTDEQMVAQPSGSKAVANHPAWVLSHLNIYLPIMVALINGQTFADPKTHEFGMQSKPELDRQRYATKQKLLDEFLAGHELVISHLRREGEAALQRETTLERWKPIMPQAGLVLPYLMLVHENTHLGQVSAWRRIIGLPAV
ncbi:MAG: DinB family protein [Planctomycetaceae bacterium]|nr:DinB family protein [Planctomycetaceae bacterium]